MNRKERDLKRLLLSLFLILLATPALCQERDSTVVASPDKEAKSPTKAMIRSALIPGGGQFYNEKPVKGILVAAAEIGSVAAFFVRRNQINDEIILPGQAPKRNIFLFSTIGVVFFSVVDAFVDAHLDSFDWGQLSVNGKTRTLALRIQRRF
ncbi:DUF5683 domain-containing protein [bacterium]|nr:DUF5683 domain-containing protein [bacterium]